MITTVDFSPVWHYRQALFYGLCLTVLVSLAAIVVGTLMAIPLALGLRCRNRWVRAVFSIIVEFVRACPPLVFLLWCHYLLPIAFGFRTSPITTSLLVFTTYFAAFAADIFRGSLDAVNKDTLHAAIALGFSPILLLRRVQIPEVFRRSLPALNSLAVNLLKMSSLASIIAVPELMYSASLILAERPRPFEVYSTIAAAYIAVIVPLVWLLRCWEKSRYGALHPSQE